MRPTNQRLRTVAVLVLVVLVVGAQAALAEGCPCGRAPATSTAHTAVATGCCSACDSSESLPVGPRCGSEPLRSPHDCGSCCLAGKQALGPIDVASLLPVAHETQFLASPDAGFVRHAGAPTDCVSPRDRERTGLAPPRTPSSRSPALLPVRLF